MLDSVFVFFGILAFLVFYLSQREESVVYSVLSTILWLVMMGQSLYIEDYATNTYAEYGFSAVCLGFAIISLVYSFMFITDWYDRKKQVI